MPEEVFVDIVDESDNRLGQIPKEDAIKFKDKITRAIAVFVVNSRGEVFLQKRSKSSKLYPLHWDCSASGLVNSEESYLEAATRQTIEGLGIRIEPYDLEFMEKVFVKEAPQQFFQAYRLQWDGLLRLNLAETDSGEFFSLYEIRKMIEKGEKFSPSFLELFRRVF